MSNWRTAWRAGIAAVALIILIATIAVAFYSRSIGLPTNGVYKFLSAPLIITLASAVLVFLVVERWRSLESGLSDLKKSQTNELREIRHDAEEAVNKKIEQTMRRAQAIESRISNLVEEHPWVADISELETIPDSPMCRLILVTAQEMLATDKPLLCYEYLSSVLGAKSAVQLEGTGDDFLALSAFCSLAISDEYLAYRALLASLQSQAAGNILLATALRSAVYFGDRKTASQLQRQLELQMSLGLRATFLRLFKYERGRRRDLEREAFGALAVFQAAYGSADKANKYLKSSKKTGSDEGNGAELAAEDISIKAAEIQCNMLLGRTSVAHKLVESWNVSTNQLSDLLDMKRSLMISKDTADLPKIDDNIIGVLQSQFSAPKIDVEVPKEVPQVSEAFEAGHQSKDINGRKARSKDVQGKILQNEGPTSNMQGKSERQLNPD